MEKWQDKERQNGESYSHRESWSRKEYIRKEIKDASQIPLYYLDMIWHLPDRTNVSREEFDMQLQEILAKDRWIIDGNYLRTMEARIAACDTIFLLDYPVELCLGGVEEGLGSHGRICLGGNGV